MSLIDILLLGIALGIDCLIVSFSQGLIFNTKRRENSLHLAGCMGLFQGLMPVICYIGTEKIYNLITAYSKCITFGIFFILGINFILKATSPKEETQKIQCINFKYLIALSIATSIDAFISGATIKLTSTNIYLAVIIIAICSFIMSILGFWGGNYIKNIRKNLLYILGGIILLILAFKSII